MLLRNLMATAVASLLFSAPAFAQTQVSLQIDPDVIHAGESARITYVNPDLKGQHVVLRIKNGDRKDPVTIFLEAQVDDNGYAYFTWDVPDWKYALIDAPGVTTSVIVILP